MNKKQLTTRTLSYLGIAFFVMFTLTVLPKTGGYSWLPWAINACTTLLFTLLVFLTARLAKTGSTPLGILLTGLFILLMCPGAKEFFQRDSQGIITLASECIVPFFMGQYHRIRRKDFHRWYAMMLLMGIFCSYTHNGVTIPLCVTFLWLSFRHLKGFFHMACWPMVIGFTIGTTLSIFFGPNHVEGLLLTTLPKALSHSWDNTLAILSTLWDTKIFVLTVGITAYLLSRKDGRVILLRITRRHYALTVCAMVSLITMPLAPLGIDNAVHGVCFFSMFWGLFLTKYLLERYWGKRI